MRIDMMAYMHGYSDAMKGRTDDNPYYQLGELEEWTSYNMGREKAMKEIEAEDDDFRDAYGQI